MENDMLKEYKKSIKNFWKNLLEGERIFMDKEAEGIEEVIKNMRKEKGFR